MNEDTGERFTFPDSSVQEGLPFRKECIRLYAADCENYARVLKAVEKKGFKGFRIYYHGFNYHHGFNTPLLAAFRKKKLELDTP